MHERLNEISETPYFHSSLSDFTKQLAEVARKLLDQYPPAIPPEAVDVFIASIASATNFLIGSTSKKIPYEIAHCLRLASAGWTTKTPLITTALSPDLYRGFYFLGVDQNFYTYAESFLEVKFTNELVQISLPEIYRRRPLYCTPLYHELGHFIDSHRGITDLSMMFADVNWPLPSFNLSAFKDLDKKFIQQRHRMEYFADLFSASYTGRSGREFLAAFAGNQPASTTHPATEDRLKVVDEFLAGKSNPILDLFQHTLATMQLNPLQIRYSSPVLEPEFDNVRPYSLSVEQEVHGIFDSGWMYLCESWEKPRGCWSTLDKSRREQAVNDLIEKSIRNHMITSKWGLHAVA